MSPLGVYFLTVCAGTLWVAFDARRFDWHRNTFCDRVWKWVVGCFLLFWVAFPAYLWHRRKASLLGTAFTTRTASFSSQAVAASSYGDTAIERAAAELAARGPQPWEPELAASAHPRVEKPPLLVLPPSAPAREATGSLGLALLAGAGAALVGGLVWAGVVIETRLDIGFLAWFVGAATGGVAFRVRGGPIQGAGRVVAALLAAGGIVVGKYVIFVHDLNKALHSQPLMQGISVRYLDTQTMSVFIHHFGSIVKPIYAVWVLFAFVAALLAAEGRKRLARRR